VASGSGAVARQVMGTTVIGGMLAASLIAVFLIPMSFYFIERLGRKSERLAAQGLVSSKPSKTMQ
jgi:HAE1 family hydrophobic/amphiphilic exporter-1